MKPNLAFFVLVASVSLPSCCLSGQWVTNDAGVVVFNQRVLPNESFSWSGGTTNGYAHGPGTLVWFTNGVENATFTGNFSNGWESGLGTYVSTDGTHGEGSWVKGKREGRWNIKWPNGGSYVGDYRNNRRTGSPFCQHE